MNTTLCSSKCSLLEKPSEGHKGQEGCVQTLQPLQLGDVHWTMPAPVPQVVSPKSIIAACRDLLHEAAEAREMEATSLQDYQ